MSLPNGSASASERTMACPAWLALPRVERSNDSSERGTQIHGYIRAVLEGANPGHALDSVSPEHRAVCVMIDWRALGGDLLAPLETEGAYAVDVRARSARFLGSNIGRGYEAAAKATGAPLGPWEVPGSLDICGRRRDRPETIVVIDTKTGFRDVTPAEENGQGLFFAAAKLLLVEHADEVEFRIAKVKASGDVHDRDRFTFTRLDVDSYLDEYEAALERAHDARRLVIARQTPNVATGGHCDYCPAFEACPAQTALARQLLPELADIDARIGAMTIGQVGAAYELAHDRVKPLLERVLDPLKERIMREGLAPYPDGKRCAKLSTYPQDRFSQKQAIALLEQLGATQDQIARCFQASEVRKVIVGNMPKAKKGRAA